MSIKTLCFECLLICGLRVTDLVPEIRNSRQHAWKVIKTRLHKLTRVYVFDSDATDLLVIGTAVQGLANGKSVSGEWVARICLEQTSPAGSLKIKSHQVWAVRCFERLKQRTAD